jgi:hypothetical protein
MRKQVAIWFSPTLCGCVLERTYTWTVSRFLRERIEAFCRDDAKLLDLWARHIYEIGHYDQVVTTYEIVRRCERHGCFPDGTALSKALLRWGQNCVRPVQCCKCSLSHCFEKSDEPGHVYDFIPLDHPMYTRRCERHAYLTDHVEHYHTVLAEARAPALALRKFREELGYLDFTVMAEPIPEVVFNGGRILDTTDVGYNRLQEVLSK